MRVCAQSSQRSTWPPSSAVRQISTAVITRRWVRLTWPALAVRHASPWSLKISATSSFGRNMLDFLPPWLLRALSTLTRKRASADRARRPIEPPTRRPAQNLPELRGGRAIRELKTIAFTPLAPARAPHADPEARQRASRPPPDRAAHTPPSAEPPGATRWPRNTRVENNCLYPLGSGARPPRRPGSPPARIAPPARSSRPHAAQRRTSRSYAVAA